MNLRKLLVVLLLPILIPFAALSQEDTQKKEFVPYEGQAGKDVIWVPTPLSLIHAMLEKAKVGPDDFVVDLGSGDGRIVIEAAKRGARAVGIEFNPEMVKLSEQLAEKEGVASKAKFLNMDLFEYDFTEATVVSMYLLSELNLRLRPKLLEMKPGTRIVSNTFNLGAWQADAEIYSDSSSNLEPEDDTHSSYNWDWMGYYWVVPANIEGSWTIDGGKLNVEQKFQMFHGSFEKEGKSFRIEEGKLTGNEIEFVINGKSYTGKVSKNSMKGNYTEGVKNSPWEATKISN